jgi:hypothetical protein
MNARDCRKMANEFLRAANLITDDLGSRLGWLLLCNVWFSLADQIEGHAASPLDNDADNRSEKQPRGCAAPATKAAQHLDVAATQLGDMLRERLTL